ncbi:hypothetical protein [Priestia abyssalis]|uniref:hypothetical protein n=1 Tax=Priestia abyssalis TaxID=1221450 RepID=UPI000995AAC4|nr:hypothetical protein [Priestia abyssalis]
MKMGLFSGILLVLFMITLSQAVDDYFWLVLVSGGLGAGALVLSGMLAKGSKSRSEEDERTAWSSNLFFFALTNLAAACTGWFLI